MKGVASLRRVALALVLLTVGYSVASAADEPVTLVHMTYIWHGDAWHRFVHEMAAEFERLHPNVHIEVMIAGQGESYIDKFRVMTAAGTPPDITDFASGEGGLAVDGLFLNLRPYIEREGPEFRELVLPNALELYTVDDVIWGMPNSLFMVVSWFNSDILSRAGLALPTDLPLSEWNWETLREYARKTTLDFDGDGQIDQWGLDRQSAAWQQLVLMNGAYLYDKKVYPTRSLWTDERVIEALEFNRRLFQDDRVASVDWDTTKHFWLGRSALSVVDGPGRLSYLEGVDFDWDIHVQPAGPQGCHCGAISGDGFQISAFTQHPDVAWEYVKFLTTRVESILAFTRLTGRFPALVGAHAYYPEINPLAPKNWRAFLEAAAQPGAQPVPVLPDSSRVSAIVNTVLDSLWRGRIPARQAAQQIHEQVQAILDAYSR